MENEQKISFWKKIKISIFDFDKYQDLAAEKITRTIGYIALIMVAFGIIVAGIYTYKFSVAISDARTYIEDNIEAITFENNKLTIIPKSQESITTIENEELGTKIIINTQVSDAQTIEKNIEDIGQAQNGILILSDRIVFENNLLLEPYTQSYESIANQYNINYIDKAEILNLLSEENIRNVYIYFYAIIFAYMFILYFSSALVDIIMLSIMGYLVTWVAKLRLKYSAVYNIAAYAITLPVLLNIVYFIVNSFTGFTIKYFQIMYTGIASIYIITAILMIKSDVIKKQIELARILEEQEKVKAELQRREEERKEQEEKERQRKEEEEKRKQEKKDKKEKKQKNGDSDLDVGNEPSVAKEQE